MHCLKWISLVFVCLLLLFALIDLSIYLSFFLFFLFSSLRSCFVFFCPFLIVPTLLFVLVHLVFVTFSPFCKLDNSPFSDSGVHSAPYLTFLFVIFPLCLSSAIFSLFAPVYTSVSLCDFVFQHYSLLVCPLYFFLFYSSFEYFSLFVSLCFPLSDFM
ncbi:hypothetical protein H1C71_030489 [Ictidomys tridecemlineatus]|nr:hypothetical protein H1C71_030489 [Ictidomys tridecemlineatus]